MPFFFFWGSVKDIVYSERVESFPELHQRITVDIAAVPVDVLLQVWDEVEFHFNIRKAISGALTELH
jgi:hypothetical protein